MYHAQLTRNCGFYDFIIDVHFVVASVQFRFRQHRMQCIYGLLLPVSHVAWSVCRSVCLSVGHVLDGVEIPHGKGQFLEVVRPIRKHLESQLRCAQQSDH